MSKLVTDLFDISEVAHHGPENLFIATLKIVGSFTLLMFINVPLTLVMLAVTAVMATYAFVQNYRKRIIFRQNRVRMAGLNARLQDSLGGIRVVKGFGNERIEIDKFGHANEEFIETKELSYRFMGQFQMASSFFTGALYTATIVGGGLFVAQGIFDPADMVMYALYIGIFIAPVELLINFTETFQKGYAGFRRFVETLAERPGVENKPDAIDLGAVVDEGIAPSISYSDVRFSYVDGKEVLRGLTLEVPAGSTVALVGPSGGGKTTTCSLLPRFYVIDEHHRIESQHLGNNQTKVADGRIARKADGLLLAAETQLVQTLLNDLSFSAPNYQRVHLGELVGNVLNLLGGFVFHATFGSNQNDYLAQTAHLLQRVQTPAQRALFVQRRRVVVQVGRL